MKKINLPYKLLIYDIETGLLNVNLFRLGEQIVRHNQLTPLADQHSIICISAKWYGKSKVYTFSGEDCVEKFDELVRKADVVLGKNSNKFDSKHINTSRLIKGLKPYPDWLDKTDDLEVQMRKYFALPSQSLDYMSRIFGNGGKEHMEFQDWVNIHNYKLLLRIKKLGEYKHVSKTLFAKSSSEVERNGKTALSKMIHYNKKDVLDTEAALIKVLPHIKLKYNASITRNGEGCTTCGSGNITPTETIVIGKNKYQLFECLSHNGYAGKATWFYKKNSHNRTYKKMVK